MKRRISIVFGIFFVLLCVFGLFQYHAPGWLVFLVIGAYLIYPSKPKNEKTAPIISESTNTVTKKDKDASDLDKSFTFPIVGVTFKNDDGTERQKLLRKIFFKDAPFDIEQNVILERYLWKDSPAYYVKVNDYVVGNIASDLVWYFEENSDRPYIIEYIKVYGGGNGINYGAEIHGVYLDV